jgi:archaellum component FlaF (FlaF/FlaG flagellin family)
VESLKARRGDLSGPVLAILVTLVLLAIGAAIVAYFVLLGAAPQQAVIAVVGQPTIVKAGADDFIANVTIKNVGSANITLQTTDVYLNITGTVVSANYVSKTYLTPGATATIGFKVDDKWSAVAGRETVSGALIVREAGTMEVVFRVIKPS